MLISILLCLVVAIPTTIWLGHREGAISTLWGTAGFGQWQYQSLANWALAPVPPPAYEIYNMIGGAVFTYLLLLFRARSVGFFLHPIGFAVGASYSNYHIWASMFVGWALKASLLRWGGMDIYRKARPLFFGLIVGDYLAAMLWVIVGMLTRTGYRVLAVP